jgi:uncharacterized protein
VIATSKKTAAALCVVLGLAGCRAEGVFYYPNKVLYADPHNAGLHYELVRYPSLNGKQLTSMLFRTEREPKGIAVHLHGNFANVSNHFPLSVFLLGRGFDLLVVDYQGFGASEGRPSPKNTVEDGIASVRYAASVDRGGGVVLFGQSIGAAVASAVAAEEPLVRAVVLEAGFTRYRTITKTVMKRSWLTWPAAFVFPPLFVRREWDPVDYVGRIAPRPVLIVHGTADGTIPVGMARELFAAAKEPKELWIIEGARHLGYRRQEGRVYEERVAGFFDKALSSKN